MFDYAVPDSNYMENFLYDGLLTLKKEMALSSGIVKFTQVSDQDGLIALIKTKQPKGTYLQIDSNDLITLPSNVITQGGTFNGTSSTEMLYLEGVHTYIQDQLNSKQPTRNYALETDLNNYLPLSGGQLTGSITINNQTPVLNGYQSYHYAWLGYHLVG